MSASASSEMTIAVIGLGHVGLPTALGLAELGWNVIGADDDREKTALIGRGEMPFYEPGLEELLRKHLAAGSFRVVPDVGTATALGNVIFVCVGTPQREDGSPDLSQVEAVARTIAHHLNGFKLIVEKSTTPIRTAEQIKRTVERYRNENHAVEIAVNPEFLREGTALQDFLQPDRIVIGVESARGRDLLLRIFQPLVDRATSPLPRPRIIVTSPNTAEVIKHAANAFLATKISFINMIADLCEASKADVLEVAEGMGLDPRIGPAFLRAGVGFGGYCLPKDLRALIRIGEEHGTDVTLLRAVAEINDQRIERLLAKLRRAVWVLSGKTIAVLGLAFKPMTDDVRGAPSLKIIPRLLAEGAILHLHDPRALASARAALADRPQVVYSDSIYDAVHGAHAAVILTEWEDYRTLDLPRVRDLMAVPVLIDGRNLWDPGVVRAMGFEYVSVGRP